MIANVTQGVQQVRDAIGNLIDRPGDKAHTRLELAQKLDYRYARQTVQVHANVALATHGETHREIIGSGDARKAFQSFTLRQAPLTYVPAPIPSGAASTLEVRVNDVRWPEVERLHALKGDERGYELRRDNDGKKDLTTVRFGDGAHGARLPTGPENVEAIYRSGIGKVGNVPAETVKMLITRPLGVKGVNNPQRASGGADRDDRDAARRNAPLAVQALDRLISAQDYADFARMFAGVGKAAARVFPRRRGKLVHVTIAGAHNIPIDVNSSLYRNLNLALRQYGDPSQPFQVDVRELLLLIVSAGVRLLPDYRWASVEPQIRSSLLETFGFERRELGQDVYAAEFIAAIQRMPGVAFVDLDFVGSLSEADSLDPVKLQQILPTPLPPRPEEGIDVWFAQPGAGSDILPAQLAILSPEIPETLVLTELP
jgi:predicted phage baseplate assembly protein